MKWTYVTPAVSITFWSSVGEQKYITWQLLEKQKVFVILKNKKKFKWRVQNRNLAKYFYFSSVLVFAKNGGISVSGYTIGLRQMNGCRDV